MDLHIGIGIGIKLDGTNDVIRKDSTKVHLIGKFMLVCIDGTDLAPLMVLVDMQRQFEWPLVDCYSA